MIGSDLIRRCFLPVFILCALSCAEKDVPQDDDVPTDPLVEIPEPEPEPESDAPVLKINAVTPGRACIRIDYSFEKVTEYNQNVNVCFSTMPEPTVDDSIFRLPPRSANKASMMGVVPNLVLEYGRTYYFRLYVVQKGGVYYSNEVKCKLEDAWEPIYLSWTPMSVSGLHPDIKAYTTTSKLNGRNFQAWYAVADLSKGNLEVRANHPSNAQTVEGQAAGFGGKCQVLVNAGYFYYEGAQAYNIGTSVIDGVPKGSIYSFAGSFSDSEPEESKTQYKVTRGVFGADAEGVPAVKWMGCVGYNHNCYYDQPLLSIKGETRLPSPSASYPVEASDWVPDHMVTAGPVLLKDGKIPFDYSHTAKGNTYFLTNYEMITYDVFTNTTGDSGRPDRSAVGITEDGKVIFFVCEGRIPSLSCGANPDEVARILKGLGCVDALNFDGGGSAKIYIAGKSYTDNDRAVMTTIGIFEK